MEVAANPRTRTLKQQAKTLGPVRLSLLSVAIGVVAGLGAVVFRGLIALFHNLFFLGKLSVVYDANAHTPTSPWGALVVLVPVVGGLGVAYLVKNFAPEAKGHGVPEVMDAIYYSKGVIRPVVAVVKSLASALSIGSGGAIGREGPIIQIGASFGSTVGQILQTPAWQRITLVAAGAAGGIAATFNTPVGGVLFAVEIVLHEISVRTLVPVAVSTAAATYVGRLFFGSYPSFVIPSLEKPYFHLTNPVLLLSYVGLGLIMGVVSAVYIKFIYGAEDLFDHRVKGNYYVRHTLGMLLVGIMMYLSMIGLGHYYIEGVGYSTIQDVLSGTLTQFSVLVLLFALKLFATSLTLGSGASGGIFSPALFIGATLGGAYGIMMQYVFPGMAISPPAFAVAGMAGVVGGATGAAMAAIVMIFEMTLDYNVIVPMTITVALAYGIRKMLSQQSIYTLKLVRRGHYMPEALQTNMQQLKRARDVMDTRLMAVPEASMHDVLDRITAERKDIAWLLVEDLNGISGIIAKDAALNGSGGMSIPAQFVTPDYVTVTEDATLFDVITKMRANQASVALVTGNPDPTSIKGLITKHQIGEAATQAAELFSDF